MNYLLWISLLLFGFSAQAAKPKFGPYPQPFATPIYESNLSIHPKSEFWKLIGFYVPQFNPASCSAASIATILNAAISLNSKLTVDSKNISQEKLIDTIQVENWKAKLITGYPPGPFGERGVTLEALEKITQEAFKKNGFKSVKLARFHAPDKLAEKNEEEQFEKNLLNYLKSGDLQFNDFILLNFDQGVLTDDSTAGHISPVGAYDEASGKVLILDVDREYYAPYWVSVSQLIKAMKTVDSVSKKTRGFIRVEI